MIKEYLKDNILITYGAMGTYYSEISGKHASYYCENANLDDKDTILKIHKKYIENGAKLIRTNTFNANTYELNVSFEELKKIIYSGIEIAEKAVNNKKVYIGASIGPIRCDEYINEESQTLNQYKYIVDCFMDKNIYIFIFETFSNCNYLKEISEYIKGKNKNAFILTQFAVKPDGYTRDGISAKNLVSTVKSISEVDAYGFNCGSGPSHLCNIIKDLDIKNDIVSVLPNAGLPEIIHERTIYPNSPKYFADKVNILKDYGVKIIGGCCGTNPLYIKEIKNELKSAIKSEEAIEIDDNRNNKDINIIENTFENKLKNNKFVYAVELTSPVDTNISKTIESAKLCRDNNIDLVTIPDSPMSKVRAESCIIASKIKREVGIECMPHICCRDRNTNAIRSSLIGANIENIRNVLAITGDSISDSNKLVTKSVFNLNSFKLIELIDNMNKDVFYENKMLISGALNLNVRNKKVEFERMKKKIEKGANLFLTQPIYDEDAIEFLKYIKANCNVKILGGILPIVSYKNAVFLNNELPGVNIPSKYMNMFKEDMTREEGEKVGEEIAVSIGRKLKEICDGLYFIIPFNRTKLILDIIKKINN